MCGQRESCEGLTSVTALDSNSSSTTGGSLLGESLLEEEDLLYPVPRLDGVESDDMAEDVGGELSCFLVNVNCQEERGGEEVWPFNNAALSSLKDEGDNRVGTSVLRGHGDGEVTGEPVKLDSDLSFSPPVESADASEGVDASATSSERLGDVPLRAAAATDGGTIDSTKTFDLGERGPSTAIGCRATVYIGNCAVDTVVDTGAHRTLLSTAVYQRLRESHSPNVGVCRPTGVVLRSASGDDCQVTGVADVTFSLQGESYTQPMYITAMGDVELLLGMDFLFAKQAVIDLKAQVLSLPGHDVPLRTRDLKSPLAARVKRAIDVEGGTQCFVQCEVLGDTESTAFDSYFEPAVALGPGAYLEPSLIRVNGACAGIVVSNYSAESVALDEGQILGMLTEPASGAPVGGVYAVHLWDGRNGTFRFRPEGASRRSTASFKPASSAAKTPAAGGTGLPNSSPAASKSRVDRTRRAEGLATPSLGNGKKGQVSPTCPEHLLWTLRDASEVTLTAEQQKDASEFLTEF